MSVYDDTSVVVGIAEPQGAEVQTFGTVYRSHAASWQNIGGPNTPQEIKRLRRENMDLCRRMGQPAIFRHMYSLEDVNAGTAQKCPSCYNNVYDHVRGDCVVCYGFGFASVELNPLPIYVTTTNTVVQTTSPAAGWIRAPRYGGFGAPILTWLVEPDVAVDVFRINDQGVMTQIYDAQGMAPWYPTMGDNDLCINVELAQDGFTILNTLDRFQLKRVQQVTIRGFGKLSRPGSNGQPNLVAQTFEMNKVPSNQHVYSIPVDAPWY